MFESILQQRNQLTIPKAAIGQKCRGNEAKSPKEARLKIWETLDVAVLQGFERPYYLIRCKCVVGRRAWIVKGTR